MKKRMKNVIKGVAVIAICAGVVSCGINTIKTNEKIRQEEEANLVKSYVYCLEENFTQRYSCASGLGKDYRYMDQLIEKYGYSYKQVGKDLYLVKPE